MASIAVITHQHDLPLRDARTGDGLATRYMVGPIAIELAKRGHEVRFIAGVPDSRMSADIAILHVDLTFVPTEYLEFAASFPICINGRVSDIAKRTVADELVGPDTPWSGRVIIKTNLNCRGFPEVRANNIAKRSNRAPPFPDVTAVTEYLVCDTPAAVPLACWADDALVVQKFLPEVLDDGFGVRFWTFLGPIERCDLCVSSTESVKSASTLRLEPSPVPDQLRTLRQHLGLDFGKIDFVIQDGSPVVIDVNKTVGVPPAAKNSDWPSRYADGVESYLGG